MKKLIMVGLHVLVALSIFACANPEKMEMYKTQQQQAIAQQADANARALAAEAQKQAHLEETKRFDILADAAKPAYWPIILVAVIFAGILLMVVRWFMITVSHVAAQIPMQPQALRMLPGDMPFGDMRRIARKSGFDVEAHGDSYFLVDGDGQRRRITALIGDGQ